MSGNVATMLQDSADKVPRSIAESVSAVIRASDRPARAAFLARVLNAVTRLAMALDETALGDVAGAKSGYESLLRALEAPEALEALQQADPLAPARIRGLREKQRLLAEGGTLTAEQVAQHLGISRQAVNKRRLAGTLIAIDTGRRGYGYPAWQFGPRGTVPGLEAVLMELRGHDAWMKLVFMLSGNTSLSGESPLTALRRGDTEAVCRAARLYGEQVAV